MTTVVLLRHGQSEANVKKVFSGRWDVPLTALGRRQAQETAAELHRRYRFDRIYTSPLCRARDTAAPLATLQGLSPIPEPGFQEIDVGEWERVPYAQMPARFPASFGTWQNDFYHCRPDGGEPVADMIRRVYDAFDRVVAANRGKTVLVATHATPVLALTARAHGYPPEDVAMAEWARNASFTVIEAEDDGTLHIPVENDYAHIPPACRPMNID